MPIPHHSPDPESHTMGPAHLQRLSQAVKELNRLINRAKHLGELAQQPLPQKDSLKATVPSSGISIPSDIK